MEAREMKSTTNYSTTKISAKKVLFVIACLAAVIIGWTWGTASCKASEERLITCWVMCKPGDFINVRRTPSRSGEQVGRLDACDSFLTDAEAKNGWIRCYGIGEYGEGYIYCGYVVTEEPEVVMENATCTAYGRVACRRWMGGPRTEHGGWLAPLSDVTVFYMTSDWACTSRGYIQTKYLDIDPIIAEADAA
jgi:hypothetical protein